MSLAPWETLDAVRTWKPTRKCGALAKVPPHVAGFHGEGPGLVATAMARDATVSVLSSKR